MCKHCINVYRTLSNLENLNLFQNILIYPPVNFDLHFNPSKHYSYLFNVVQL